jgi:hypothetical protein
MPYDVCVLLEQALTAGDAEQVVDLHADAPEPAHYHVLLPVSDAAVHMESALGSLAATEVVATAPLSLLPEETEQLREELRRSAAEDVARSVAALQEWGASADGEVVTDEPVRRLVQAVTERDSREVIVLTRPHLVAELFHTDWTHRARKHLGVPVLHLLAHRR